MIRNVMLLEVQRSSRSTLWIVSLACCVCVAPLRGQSPEIAVESAGPQASAEIDPVVGSDALDVLSTTSSASQTPSTSPGGMGTASTYALILLGLPGTKEHETQQTAIARAWIRWLRGPLQIPIERIWVCRQSRPGDEASSQLLGNSRESITQAIDQLSKQLSPTDQLWVFFLGHGSFDERDVFFHIPGRDMSGVEYAERFDAIRCQRQVFWLTMSCAGHFLPALSRPERVVITATTMDAEPNETEFPQALVDVIQRPAAALDRDHNGEVTLLEIFAAVVEEVARRYASDGRAATEHALLDDNGDRRGTEWEAILAASARSTDTAPATELPDGTLAQSHVIQAASPPISEPNPSEQEPSRNE